MWLTVDNQLIKKVKAPRKFNVGQELFLGSVPSNVARPEDVQVRQGRLCVAVVLSLSLLFLLFLSYWQIAPARHCSVGTST